MANLNLDFVVVQTNNTTTMTIVDSSTYPNDPPNVSAPTIEITVPAFGTVSLPFAVNSYNIFNSASLGLSEVGNVEEIPDGVYFIKYSIAPAFENYVEHSIIRVDKLQEKFDQAFMTLDMMECDRAIKEQSFVTLNTIYLFIQGAVAAANNCATIEANNLYKQADNALDHFIRKDCGCSGTNRLINFN
jgi:hypothetical protein